MSYDENRISDLIDGGLYQQEIILKTLDRLIVGAIIIIGEEYSNTHGLPAGKYPIMNSGLEPSIINKKTGEILGISHLFGLELENFMDCDIID